MGMTATIRIVINALVPAVFGRQIRHAILNKNIETEKKEDVDIISRLEMLW